MDMQWNTQWNLLRLRKQRNLSQEEIAKEVLNITAEAYGQKERGERAFTSDEMFKLSDYFEKPIDRIFLPRKIGMNDYLVVVKAE